MLGFTSNSLCHNNLTMQLEHKSSHRQYINKWPQLCFNKTLFIKQVLSWILPVRCTWPVSAKADKLGPRKGSVQFSLSVVSDSLQPHESQHARPPCPSATLRVHSNSCPSSWWCHPAISSYVVPFSSCPQSLPASGSFPMSQLFTWGGQSTGVSASASFLPKNTRTDLLQNGLVGSPCSPRDSQESSPTPQFKSINSSALSFLHSPTLTSIHDH